MVTRLCLRNLTDVSSWLQEGIGWFWKIDGYGFVVLFQDFCAGVFHHMIDCLSYYLSVEDLCFCCWIMFVEFFGLFEFIEIIGFLLEPRCGNCLCDVVSGHGGVGFSEEVGILLLALVLVLYVDGLICSPFLLLPRLKKADSLFCNKCAYIFFVLEFRTFPRC